FWRKSAIFWPTCSEARPSRLGLCQTCPRGEPSLLFKRRDARVPIFLTNNSASLQIATHIGPAIVRVRPFAIASSRVAMMKRTLILVPRWLGVLLFLFFLLWFPSGIVMMYWDFPSVRPADRLERAPTLRAESVILSPAEAAAKLSDLTQAAQV